MESQMIRLECAGEGEYMEIYTSETIREVHEKEWNTLTGPDAIEHSYKWLRTVEEAGQRDLVYVFVRDHGSLQAAACCIVMKEKLHIMNFPLLEVRSPFAASPGFFSTGTAYTQVLLKKLEEVRIEKKTLGYVILDLPEDQYISLKPHMSGLSSFPMMENTYIDLHYADFDQYLKSLEEYAWRSARMTLNRAKRWKIKTVFTPELSQWAHEAHRLQEYTCRAHHDFQWLLPEGFYRALEENLSHHVELQLFFKDDILLASSVVLDTPTTCYYRFPGIDPRYRKYQAYFLMYYEGIRHAFEKNHKRIYFGLTGYTFKRRIGCKMEPLFGFSKMKNILFDVGFKTYVSLMRKRKKK